LNITTTKFRRPSRTFVFLTKGSLCFICIILLCNISYARTNSEANGAAEYAVKAAYIYNILRFVSWDKNTPLAQSDSLNVCLFRDNPFNRYLDPIRGKSIGNKKIKLRTINDVSQSASCHLIFIDDNDYFDTEKIKQQIKRSDSILLGNDIEFVKNGGLFSFYIENNKVKLGANRSAIADTELNISSQLIEVCQLYGEQK